MTTHSRAITLSTTHVFSTTHGTLEATATSRYECVENRIAQSGFEILFRHLAVFKQKQVQQNSRANRSTALSETEEKVATVVFIYSALERQECLISLLVTARRYPAKLSKFRHFMMHYKALTTRHTDHSGNISADQLENFRLAIAVSN